VIERIVSTALAAHDRHVQRPARLPVHQRVSDC
jgi:hypothetical protein